MFTDFSFHLSENHLVLKDASDTQCQVHAGGS